MGSAFARPTDAKITAVNDGDSLTVVFQGQTQMVRLACIDAPEFKQTGGTESTQRLKQLVPIGSTVQIAPRAIDQYNRVVGVVFGKDNEGKNFNVNLQMVAEGRAVVYKQYLNNCSDIQEDLLAAETFAKNMALGIASEPNCSPAEFRRGQCANRSHCESSYPEICIPVGSPDLDCGEVPYRNIRVVGNDPHRFDRDGDGVGCEG